MSERLISFEEFESISTKILSSGMQLRFKANGSSMRPFIYDGDVVTIVRVEVQRLKRGEVILARLESGRIVVHRILRCEGQSFLVQGDALLHPDGYVSYENILGKVVSINRAGREHYLDTGLNRLAVTIWVWFSPIRKQLLYVVRLLRKLTIT